MANRDDFVGGVVTSIAPSPLARNEEGEHNIFNYAGLAVTTIWAFAPPQAKGVAISVSVTYGAIFSIAGQASNGNVSGRDTAEAVGAVVGSAIGGVLGSGFFSLFLGYIGGQVGGLVGGSVYDYMYDPASTPIQPPQIIVNQTRRDRITSDDSGMQARYDNPKDDVQTASGLGVTRAYVDAYARGDLAGAAQLLTTHGANIYPGPANGFYPDRIIRQLAGYEGGAPLTPNQALIRDDMNAARNDPSFYPDGILRQAAGNGGGSGGGSGGSSTSVVVQTPRGVEVVQVKPTTGGYGAPPMVTRVVDTPSGLQTVVVDNSGKEDRRPILLDLDGDGIEISALGQSAQHIVGADGLQHRTAWAGAGDGVLFIDADGDGEISNLAEYVFTEWDRSASDDMEALRRVLDTNGDGKLNAADARWGEFRVMVTHADGTTTTQSLSELGITEINLRPDVTRITLPDGSRRIRDLGCAAEQLALKCAA